MTTNDRSALALCALLALGGCYSGVQGFDGDDPGADPNDTADQDGEPAADDEPEGEQAQCGEPTPAQSPMRRLTRLEYDNTVRDLLGDTTRPARRFSPDEELGGFAANSIAPLSENPLNEYMAAAEDLAKTAVSERWDAVVGCDAAEAGCVEGFVASFGRRAFRRSLTEAERTDYLAVYHDAAAEWGATEGVAVVIHAMLMSPLFLYHVEPISQGTEPGEVAALTGPVLASRLSYFVWASMPDDVLLDAAEAGELSDRAGIEAQVRRMLEHERAADAIASFHEQWLHLQGLPDRVKDAALFPEWNPSLGESMEQETLRFADAVIRHGDGSLRTLLTAPWTMADESLADLYGVQAPTDVDADGFGQVELPDDERAGLLTHASFLTSTAHAAESSWVFRGKFVRERLLCQVLPPPPPGAETMEVNDPNRLENPECSGCHTMMDPIGVGLDAYTPIGAFEPEGPDGEPIPVQGEVKGAEGLGAFEGAVDLARALAESPQVHDCVAEQWFQYGARRLTAEVDECTLEHVREAFTGSDLDVRELIVAIAVSDAFRFQINE
ncbi:DUF1592 domain-containing protein [Paraliomyxa miuraensis]|uniref:DUF1592 domain-containing protein n=1 Tax=Paraliomyxa miuraensis TaxID=376150 RepID=UPI00225243A4|nr:DUF1592 domain-containing protein [Paraliomyxa miuraensis]MCX4241199.1 DUF1592 domain-containing protein [Paraliomyxa miuraensis]